MTTALNRIIHVHLHEFEDEGEATGRLIVQDLVEFDDLCVR